MFHFFIFNQRARPASLSRLRRLRRRGLRGKEAGLPREDGLEGIPWEVNIPISHIIPLPYTLKKREYGRGILVPYDDKVGKESLKFRESA